MEGKITIEYFQEKDGYHSEVDVDLGPTDLIDRLMAVNEFCKVVGLDDEEKTILATLYLVHGPNCLECGKTEYIDLLNLDKVLNEYNKGDKKDEPDAKN